MKKEENSISSQNPINPEQSEKWILKPDTNKGLSTLFDGE